MDQREDVGASMNGRKLPSESFAMRVLKMQLTGASLTVASRELAPKVMKVITMCDDNLQDSDLLKLQMFCYLPRIKFNLDALYLHRNQITDLGVKYLLNAYVPDFPNKPIPQTLLDRIVQENIKGFINAPGYRSVVELNLSSNQIGDEGAKLLADSLVKGEMPKLKVLHLYGNKITDEGYGFLIDSLKAISQHIVVKLQKYSSDLGHKFIKPALKEFIKYAQEKGVDTTHIVTDKESLDYIKNIKTIRIYPFLD